MEATILFGNGLNRFLTSNISWDALLDKIKGVNIFEDDQLPNTMIYERIVLNHPKKYDDILTDEFEVKEDIANLLANIQPNHIYIELFRLNIQHYITTNYDYGFVDSILDLPEINPPLHDFSTEDIYSIRRLKIIRNIHQKKKHFWQIHGEIRQPATIMLGLDHYCGYISKINSYIKGNYRYNVEGETIVEQSIENKFNDNKFINSSWVELFFITNIHILGFSLNFSEIDLWWIINKRARMKKSKTLGNYIQNEIHFYCDKMINQKKELLESFDVFVHLISIENNSYIDHFKSVLENIKAKI